MTAPASPDRAAIQNLAAAVLKTKQVRVERLNGYLHQTYQLRGDGGAFCLLKSSPVPGTKLLALEEDRLGVEASVLSLLGRRVDIAAPKLLEYQAASGTYIISGPYSGSIMSFAARPLSASDRIAIDRSLGAYIRRLSSITHQSFGPFRRPTLDCWAKYFAMLLESVIRDGQRYGVSLPYDEMRSVLRKHAASLNDVEDAKLTMLEVSSTENIIVDGRAHDVTSLVDYSTAIWGDPFMSDAFHRPSKSFLEGFGEGIGGDNDKRIRHLFYIIYHSLVAIVRQHYRPRSDGRSAESTRSLMTALRYLKEIPV